MGISYNAETEQVAVMIQSKMSVVRDFVNEGDRYDTMLLLMDKNGVTSSLLIIHQGTSIHDMYGARNGIFLNGDNVFFAGYSDGFSTRRQDLSNDMGLSDAYIYKHRFGVTNDCLSAYEYDNSVIQNMLDQVNGDSEAKL